MKKIFQLISLAGLVAMAGCATGPDFKTYNASLSAPKEGESRIWFYRPSKFLGSGIQPMVYINDTPIGKSQPGCFFYADRAPGTYEFRCTTEWADKTLYNVVANQVTYVRLSLLPGVLVYHILPRIVPEAEALKELQDCRLITADGMNQNWAPPPAKADSPPQP